MKLIAILHSPQLIGPHEFRPTEMAFEIRPGETVEALAERTMKYGQAGIHLRILPVEEPLPVPPMRMTP